MLQVRCCQQQLKCSYCWLRLVETLVAAWKLLKQIITRYRPLQQLEYSTCATHAEGQTWNQWTRLWFRKGRCDGCTHNLQSNCRWNSWPAPIYHVHQEKHVGKAYSYNIEAAEKIQKSSSMVPLNLLSKCVHWCNWCTVWSIIVKHNPKNMYLLLEGRGWPKNKKGIQLVHNICAKQTSICCSSLHCVEQCAVWWPKSSTLTGKSASQWNRLARSWARRPADAWQLQSLHQVGQSKASSALYRNSALSWM